MFKGLLSGALVGVVVSVGAAAGLSVLIGGPRPADTQPKTGAVNVPAGSEFNKPREDKKANLPESEPVMTEQVVPKVTAPKPDSVAPVVSVAKAPGAHPVASQEPGGMAPPKPGGEAITPPVPVTSSNSENPLKTAVSSAPKPPSGEAALSISTEPAQPAPPAPDAPKTAFETAKTEPEPAPKPESAAPKAEPVATAPEVQSAAPVEPPAPVVTAEVSSGAASASGAGPETAKPAPQQTVQTPMAPNPVSEEPVIRVGPAPEPKEKPQPAPKPEVAQAPKPAEAGEKTEPGEVVKDPEPKIAAVDPTPAPEPVPAPEPTPKPEAVRTIVVPPAKPVTVPQRKIQLQPEEPKQAQAEAEAPPPAIRIGKPAGSFKTVGSRLGNSGGALPSIGGAAQVQKGGDPGNDLPPIERYAIDYNALETNPKMAIVLIDEGEGAAEIKALAGFPYPLAIAVDTSRDDAKDRMAIYRASGFEVLAMVALPEGASPTDVEVAMPVLMGKVPEAVGVMEAPGDGIQFDRKVSDQVAQILGASGHGLLLYSKGLNTAQKLAAKNGVPSATIFRDFDEAGQNARTIRRFLNNGALRADSEGGVVMVGRMRPETVKALLVWGLDERAGQISLAPVSALLRAQ